MKLNYIPGLALRFYPGLTRELYDGVDEYIAANCKLVLMTGAAPSETDLWNLTDLEAFVLVNSTNVVYRETTSFKFSYNGFKHHRTIQRWPIDSTPITTLNDIIAQPTYTQEEIGAGAIKSDNSLYALIYCPDKDATANTAGNDLVMVITNVGSKSDDFVSLSNISFLKDANIYLRNITISLFQGYQITDGVITGDLPDPDNVGETITGPIGTKKSIYYNKVWGNRISEAYRDCFVSKDAPFKFKNATYPTGASFGVLAPSYFQDLMWHPLGGYWVIPRKYDIATSSWLSTYLYSELDKTIYYGYLVNESMVNLIDEINAKGMLGQLGEIDNLINTTNVATSSTHRFSLQNVSGVQTTLTGYVTNKNQMDLIPATLAKFALFAHMSPNIKASVRQILIEQGLDSGMIDSALESVIPIGFDNTKYSSVYDKDQNVLTIQNATPAKLKTRYKKTIHNPTNEQLYIVLPRFISRAAIENPYGVFTGLQEIYNSISSVSYPATSKVIDGEVVDNTTQRIRQQDYTAISIGLTGNGNTDLEYDLIDTIDYIDSFTAMVKIPNKF